MYMLLNVVYAEASIFQTQLFLICRLQGTCVTCRITISLNFFTNLYNRSTAKFHLY